ncbi:MAG: tyrosine-type recombinase/integrase [Actinomycetota bacterium]
MIKKRGTRWRVVVQAEADPVTGKRRQLSGSAASRREAVALERQLGLRAEAGIVGPLTLARLVEEWWESGPRLAPTTQANYRDNLDNHILPVLGPRKIEDIRPRLVAGFLDHLGGEKGLAPATVRNVRTVLSHVMSYAVAMEYAESNPVQKVPPPPLDDADGVAPTVEEAARILLCAEATDPEFLTYLWVSAEEGGRRGEILDLRWKGVDFEKSEIAIEGVVSIGDDGCRSRPRTKTGKPRSVAVSTITLRHLAEHKRRYEESIEAAGLPGDVDPDAYVFSGGRGSRRDPLDGRPWRPDSTSRRFRQLKERAGVRPEIDLHGLRRTMVTELLVAGVDPRTVMGRAGHKSEAVTMGLYAKVRPAADTAAAELWGQLLDAKLREFRNAPDRVAFLDEAEPREQPRAAGHDAPRRQVRRTANLLAR